MLQRVSLLSEEQAYKTWGGSSSLQDLRAATGLPSAPALSWPGGRSPFAYGTVTKPLLYTEMFAFPVFWESFSGENPPSTPDMGSLWTSHPLFFSLLLHCGLRCSLEELHNFCLLGAHSASGPTHPISLLSHHLPNFLSGNDHKNFLCFK